MTEVRRGVTIAIRGDERDFAESTRQAGRQIEQLERRLNRFHRREQAFLRSSLQTQLGARQGHASQVIQAQRQADRLHLESQRVAGRQQVEIQRQTGRQRLEAQRQTGRQRLAAERAAARRELEIIRETGRQARFEQQRADRLVAARRRRSGAFAFGSLVPFAGAFAIQQLGREVLRLSDQWTIANSRVRLYTDSVAEAQAIQQQLFNLSQETRSELGATVLVYQRISQAGETLGVSQERLLGFVETLNKALLISGVTAAEARATIIQLGQGLASDELRGQELRSVFEQGPRIAQALAESLNLSLGQLRELAFSGGLTARTVFAGIESQAQKIEAEFERINVTGDQAFTVLGNSLSRAIGQFGQASGAAENFSQSVIRIGRDLDETDFSGLGRQISDFNTRTDEVILNLRPKVENFLEATVGGLRRIGEEQDRLGQNNIFTLFSKFVGEDLPRLNQFRAQGPLLGDPLAGFQPATTGPSPAERLQQDIDQINRELPDLLDGFIENLTEEVQRDLAELARTPPPTPIDRNLRPIDTQPDDQVRAAIAAEEAFRNDLQRRLDRQRIDEIRQRLRSIEGVEVNIDLRGLSSDQIEQTRDALRGLANEQFTINLPSDQIEQTRDALRVLANEQFTINLSPEEIARAGQQLEQLQARLVRIGEREYAIDLRGLSPEEIAQVRNALRQLADQDIERLHTRLASLSADRAFQISIQASLDEQRLEVIRRRLASIEGVEVNVDLRGLSSEEIAQVRNALRQLADQDLQQLQTRIVQSQQAMQRWAEINAQALRTVRQELFGLLSGFSTFEQFLNNMLRRIGEIAFNQIFDNLTASLQTSFGQGQGQSVGTVLLNTLLPGAATAIGSNRAAAGKPTVQFNAYVQVDGQTDPNMAGAGVAIAGDQFVEFLDSPEGSDTIRSISENN